MNFLLYNEIAPQLSDAVNKGYRAGLAAVVRMNKKKILKLSDASTSLSIRKQFAEPLFQISYNKIDERILKNFNVEAFTVAGVLHYEAEEKLKAMAASILDGSHPLVKENPDIDRKKLWIAEAQNIFGQYTEIPDSSYEPSILNTNLRTATVSAYHGAQWQRLQELKDVYPAYQYKTVGDNRVRDEHAILADKVFQANDPIWNKIYPPNGWNCFPLGTEVLTEKGYAAIEKITQGMRVVGGSGNLKPVDVVHCNPFNGELIVVETGKGNFSCTQNHRVLTLNGWIEARALKRGDIIVKIREDVMNNIVVGNIQHRNSGATHCLMTFSSIMFSMLKRFNTKFQFGNVKINSIRRDAKIPHGLKTKRAKMFKKFLFNCRQRAMSIDKLFGIMQRNFFFCIAHFFSNFRSLGRSCGFQMFSHQPDRFRVSFIFSRAAVNAVFFHPLLRLFHSLGCKAFPFRLMKILNFHGFASCARRNIVEFHQSNNRARLHLPAFGKHSIRKKLRMIQRAESIGSGAPLDAFNSLNRFRLNALFHNEFVVITKIEKKNFSGNVYNLSVRGDESYNIRAGIVHNCRCYVNALSSDELNDVKPDDRVPLTNIEEHDSLIKSASISKEFQRNSGQAESIWGKWLQEKLSGKNYDVITHRMKEFVSAMPDADEAIKKIEANASAFRALEYTKENFEKEFPDNSVMTPLGEFEFRKNFFDKLDLKERTDLLGLVKPTMEQPDYIIVDARFGTLFVKAFNGDGNIIYAGVISDKDGLIVSFHNKENIKGKIKNGKLLIYQSEKMQPDANSSASFVELSSVVRRLNFAYNNVGKDSDTVNEIWGEFISIGKTRVRKIRYKVEGFEIAIDDGDFALKDYSEIDEYRKGVLMQ
ncbi:MAG: hypothetical protein H3C35_08505 [Bacteroidetes bacterium]|nr:hypothetical protein [Bacteroidota bacterium]